jgi:type IV pilus assembly protein PilC
MPLINALNISSKAAGNLVFQDAILSIRENVSSGEQFHFAMNATHRFPNMVVQMAAIGEESGELDAMMNKAASIYEEDVDTTVDSLSSLLEPAIMAILGVLVGGLVIAMYLPIFNLGKAF